MLVLASERLTSARSRAPGPAAPTPRSVFAEQPQESAAGGVQGVETVSMEPKSRRCEAHAPARTWSPATSPGFCMPERPMREAGLTPPKEPPRPPRPSDELKPPRPAIPPPPCPPYWWKRSSRRLNISIDAAPGPIPSPAGFPW